MHVYIGLKPLNMLPTFKESKSIPKLLKSSDILYNQFGFLNRHSTNYTLPSIIEQIRSLLDKKMYTCGVFVDLEKAFDTFIKIRSLWYWGVANSWFASYLSNR